MRLHLIIITVLVSLLLSSCSQKRKMNQVPKPQIVSTVQTDNRNNHSVTANIKEKLDNTKELQGFQIYPHIQDGKTLLSGIVNTKREKILAGSIARSVEGSGVVVNRLVIN